MPQLNWTLKAYVTGNDPTEFTSHAQLTFTVRYDVTVPKKGTAEITPSAGWTKGVRLFVMSFGDPDVPVYWGFDAANLVLADETLVTTGEVACSLLLTARKSIHFKNDNDVDKIVTVYIGHLKGRITSTATEAYVELALRAAVQPDPLLSVYPNFPDTLRDAGSVQTTLPNNACLKVPIMEVQGGIGISAFVIAASKYLSGFNFSLDGGTNWTPLTQSYVLLGLEACAYLPSQLSAVDIENRSGEDIALTVIVGQWTPPFKKPGQE